MKRTKLNYRVISLALIFGIIGYCTGFFLNTYNEPTEPHDYRSTNDSMPFCLMGICPIFYSMDITKGETQSYTVVVQPTHMSKGAGQVWVIDGGQRIIFKSDTYAQVGVVPSESSDGFYITYTTGDNYDIKRADRVIFDKDITTVAKDVPYPTKN